MKALRSNRGQRLLDNVIFGDFENGLNLPNTA